MIRTERFLKGMCVFVIIYVVLDSVTDWKFACQNQDALGGGTLAFAIKDVDGEKGDSEAGSDNDDSWDFAVRVLMVRDIEH